MTNDTFETSLVHALTEDFWPTLAFPAWAPTWMAAQVDAIADGLVAEERFSRQMHEAGEGVGPLSDYKDRRELLERLACHSDMQAVWDEIYKRRRQNCQPTKEFLHPAQRKGLQHIRRVAECLDAAELQDFAASVFFEEAFYLAGWPTQFFLSRKDIDQLRKPYLKIAKNLRREAGALASLAFPGTSLANKLLTIAADCEHAAEREPPYNIPVAARPEEGDQALRAYVLRMTRVCQIIFGKSLNGTVANTANVALWANVTRQQVRDMVARV